MSKYKVGDVVRIKEMAGMIRSPYSGMSAKVVALYEFPERLNYFYILDVDMGRHAWSEDMLDDPKEEAKVELSIYDIYVMCGVEAYIASGRYELNTEMDKAIESAYKLADKLIEARRNHERTE